MRTETRQVHIGEYLGPVDWGYDFTSHDWDHGGAVNPVCVVKCVEMLRRLVEGIGRGEEWEATEDGGSPRCGWGTVGRVGMYDGWPYWRPVPSVYINSWLGGSWTSFCGLSEVRLSTEDAATQPHPNQDSDLQVGQEEPE